MTKTDLNDHEVDDLFAATRAGVPEPSADFLARLEADAIGALCEGNPREMPVQTATVWAQVRSVFGGWTGVGGLVAATVAGIWLGVSPPSGLPDPAQVLSGQLALTDTFEIWLDPDGADWLDLEGS